MEKRILIETEADEADGLLIGALDRTIDWPPAYRLLLVATTMMIARKDFGNRKRYPYVATFCANAYMAIQDGSVEDAMESLRSWLTLFDTEMRFHKADPAAIDKKVVAFSYRFEKLVDRLAVATYSEADIVTVLNDSALLDPTEHPRPLLAQLLDSRRVKLTAKAPEPEMPDIVQSEPEDPVRRVDFSSLYSDIATWDIARRVVFHRAMHDLEGVLTDLYRVHATPIDYHRQATTAAINSYKTSADDTLSHADNAFKAVVSMIGETASNDDNADRRNACRYFFDATTRLYQIVRSLPCSEARQLADSLRYDERRHEYSSDAISKLARRAFTGRG